MTGISTGLSVGRELPPLPTLLILTLSLFLLSNDRGAVRVSALKIPRCRARLAGRLIRQRIVFSEGSGHFHRLGCRNATWMTVPLMNASFFFTAVLPQCLPEPRRAHPAASGRCLLLPLPVSSPSIAV